MNELLPQLNQDNWKKTVIGTLQWARNTAPEGNYCAYTVIGPVVRKMLALDVGNYSLATLVCKPRNNICYCS